MINFCPMCGQKIVLSSKFCNSCGLNLIEYQRKLNILATESANAKKPISTRENTTAVVATEPQKKSPIPVKTNVPQKNKPSKPIVVEDGNLSAEEYLERGIFAYRSELYKEAIQYYAQAIKRGNTEAMYRLGYMYDIGNGVEKDDAKALAWYLKSAKLGNTTAMLRAEKNLSKKATEGTTEKAKSLLIKAAEKLEPLALCDLGRIYFEEKNLSQGRNLLESAVYFGELAALEVLGIIYESEESGIQNIPKAFQCYQRLAECRDKFAKIISRGCCPSKEALKFQMKFQSQDSDYYHFQLGKYVLSYGKVYDEISEFMSNFLHKLLDVIERFKSERELGGKLSSHDIHTTYHYGRSLLEELADEGIKVYSKRGDYAVTAKQVVNADGKDLYGVDDRIKEIFSKTPKPIDIWSKYYNKETFQEAVIIVRGRILAMLGFTKIILDEEEAERIKEQIEQAHLPEDKYIEALTNVLLKSPYDVKAYEIYLRRYGDERLELRNLALFFGWEKEVNVFKKKIFLERINNYSHKFQLFPLYKIGDNLQGKDIFSSGNIPTYSDLKRDYRIIDSEALKLQLNIYGEDNISYFAFVYRMLLRAFEDEKAAAHDDNRIHAFQYFRKQDLGDVVVPEGIETIGAFAFAEASMESIKLPSTLKKIEAGAFYLCSISSKKIEVPEGVEEISINMIGQAICNVVYLPNSIRRISGEAVYLDSFLPNIFKDTNPFIKDTIFYFDFDRAEVLADYFEKNDLMKHTPIFTLDELNSSVPNVSNINFFENNFFIKDVFSNEEAYEKIFRGHPFTVDLSNETIVKNNVPLFIGYRAFANSHVTRVTLNEYLTVIRDEAFYNCQDLEFIKLPRSLEKLGSRAFRECKNLEYVIIPDTLKNIGDDILRDCPATIYCDSNSFAAEYCRKNNLPMEDYGAIKLQEGKRLMTTSQNRKEAERAGECFELAAYIGNIEGTYEAAKYKVFQKNFLDAEEYFKRAALAGYKPAMIELYKMYRDGVKNNDRVVIEPNFPEAEKWLIQSGYDEQTIQTTSSDSLQDYVERMRFVDKLFERFKHVSCLYFSEHGNKAYDKIEKAIQAYAQKETPSSVICVFDDTFMGGAEDGFIVTNKTFYAHNAFSNEVIKLPLKDFQSIIVQKGNLIINNSLKVSIAQGGKSAQENVPLVLNEIKNASER